MDFQLMRNENGGLVLNETGDFLAKDNRTNAIVWLHQCMIKYNEQNQAYIEVRSQKYPTIQGSSMESNGTEYSFGEPDVNEDSHEERNNNVNEETIGEIPDRQTWQNDETLALISAVEARYDELYHPKTKKGFWNRISEELLSQKVQFSALACHRKWQNLQRTYKPPKDLKKKTGRSLSRFLYFDRLNELLGEKPNNSSPHSIDVATMQVEDLHNSESTPNTGVYENNTENKTTPAKTRKRTNPSMELVKIKENYYLKKEATLEKRQKDVEQYLAESLQIKREKLELYKRKMNVIEQYNAKIRTNK